MPSRLPIPAPALAAVLLAAGCAHTLPITELDRLNRSTGALTVVLEPELSLYSPYDLDATEEFVELVREERGRVAALFGSPLAEPVVLWLVQLEGLGPRVVAEGETIRTEFPREHPRFGVEGKAAPRWAIVYVDEPQEVRLESGRVLIGRVGASSYRGVVRHELAHIHAHAAGLSGDTWFDEGLALEVGSMRAEDGGLAPDHDSEELLAAARIPRAERSLEGLLLWREDVARIERGLERPDPRWRLLAQAWIHWLVWFEQGEPLLPALRRIRAMDRSRLLALEPRWQAWLDSLVPRGPAGGVSPGAGRRRP